MGVHLDIQFRDRGAQYGDLFQHGEGIQDAQGVAEAETVGAVLPGDGHEVDQKLGVGTAGVLAPDADVEAVVLGETQGALELLAHPPPALVDLVLDHDVGNAQRDVHRLDAAGDAGLDVGDQGAVPGDEPRRQPQVDQGPDRVALLLPHGRNAAFQLVHPHGIQMPGDRDLLLGAEYHPRSLLTVAQSGVAYKYRLFCG